MLHVAYSWLRLERPPHFEIGVPLLIVPGHEAIHHNVRWLLEMRWGYSK